MNFVDYLFEHAHDPEKECILSRDGILTYGELVARIDDLAAYLNDTVGTGKECLLLAENSFFFIVAYLAIIKSGNTALLVETRIDETQLAAIYRQCSIRASFIQNKYRKKTGNVVRVYSEDLLECIQECIQEAPRSQGAEVRDDDVAVVIFTSGSTGAKKGVMLTHKNLCSNTESIVKYLGLTPADRICVTLPLFYCYGASLLHTHLRAGGSVLLSAHIFLGGVIRDINTYHCTGLAGVPSTYQILINRTPFLKEKFPSLRSLQQAGGQLPNKYIRMIAETFPEKKFFLMYGATEATARLSFLPPDKVLTKLGSVGRGIPGVMLEVLNKSGRKVKPGEIGEITASGDNIMKGYYGDQMGTGEVIRSGKLFTGDLATVDDEGYIFIHGRAKNIIKSGGYRISPTEIEEFICAIDGVDGCVVLGIPDEIMGESVIAIVQPTGIFTETQLMETVFTHCRRNLPSYKIPGRIFLLKDFPLNASGKVDKPALTILIQEEIRKNPKAGQ